MAIIKKPYELIVQPSIKVLIYGQPGVRKTTLALSTPSPLLLDFDNGVHRVDPRHQCDTVQISKWEDIIELLDEDLSAYKTLVIDTAGKMLDYMGAYIIQQDPKMGQRDGSLQLKGYGARKVMFINFLKKMSTMVKHLVFVAHEKEDKEGDQKIIRPEIGGSSSGDLIKELDLVGYMQSIGSKKTISFEPCEKFYGKNTCKLPSVIELADTIDVNDQLVAPNTQLGSIFEKYIASQEDRRQLGIQYNELLEVIGAKVESIDNAVTANEVVQWATSYDGHIWDSRLQASLAIKERATTLELLFDKNTKQYSDPVREVESGGKQTKKTVKPQEA